MYLPYCHFEMFVLQMVTDVGFGVSWDGQTKTHFNRSTTYNYIFDYRGRNSDSLFPEWMGRCNERVNARAPHG